MFTRAATWLAMTVCLATAAHAVAQADRAQAEPGDASVVAILHGNVIRLHDLDEYWRRTDPKSFQILNEQLRNVRERMLDGLIGDRLLAREAERQRTTVERLVAGLTVPAFSDAEIHDLYERSSAAQQGVTIEMARPAIETYLRGQRAREVRDAYVNELRRASRENVSVRLEAERQTIPVSPADPIRGDRAAPIDIVEFSDFECPYCAQAEPVLGELLKKFAGRVRLVWKDMPLPIHPSAVPGARAARCAGEQQQFWAYHDVLFAHQQKLEQADLVGYARDIGLDVVAFSGCLASRRYLAQMVSDTERAAAYGVSATPTVFINGRPFTGVVPIATYERAIEEELERSVAGQVAK